MRMELLNELKATLVNMGIAFNKGCKDTFYKQYNLEADPYGVETPEEVFNKDGVIAIYETVYGDAFITGLTEDEIEYLEN